MSNLKYKPNQQVIFRKRKGYCNQTVIHYCSGAVANRYKSLDDIPESCGGIYYESNLNGQGEAQ